jgi:hypothetical protein
VLIKAGAVLLLVWLVGALGLFDAGPFLHGLLLTGLMLLLLGVLKGREAAERRGRGEGGGGV